jgi:hypothetical protein
MMYADLLETKNALNIILLVCMVPAKYKKSLPCFLPECDESFVQTGQTILLKHLLLLHN